MTFCEQTDAISCNSLQQSIGQLIQAAIVQEKEDIGEFEWDKPLQSEVLSAFFYGYVITQILGGWLARKYGCRLILGIGMLLSALATALFPICARTHIYLVFANRFITGLGTSVCIPAVYALWGRWAPPLERTKLISFSMSGVSLGAIVSNSLSGYLCKYGFDNGWGSIFYVFGGGSILWLTLWFFVVYDSPADHPRISAAERDYIQKSMGIASSHTDTEHKTPWVAILKSRSIWVVAFGHFCVNWLNLTLATDLPTYMKEVLKFDVKANGLLSSVPYITNIASSITAGILADKVRRKKLLSTTATRRVFTAVAFIGSGAFLVAAGFVNCDWRWEAVIFLAVANGFLGLTRGGCMVNHVDFGRRYAGELYGITNTIANAPGMVVPIVNGALTPSGTREEWLHVFMLCGILCFLGTVVFSSMGRGEPEPWAETPTTIELEDMNRDMSKSGSMENGTAEAPVTIELQDTSEDISNSRSLGNGTASGAEARAKENQEGHQATSRK
ncbi:sialin-like [Liolophura sinensis]|uniref:sialin-like n=1 Tax=Liolophura sinensis TaxID=3198878 RepID=UPI0031592B5C